MFRLLGLLLLALTGLLSGCDQIRSLMPAPDVPPAISLKREELLKVVLFNSPTKDAGSIRISVLSGQDKFEGLVKVNPKEVVQIDAENAVLITENQQLDEKGSVQNSHASGALIGGYFFKRTKVKTWQLTKKMDGIRSVGVFGLIGKTTIHKLAESHFALSVQNGSCWQGSCPEWISVYGIKPNQILDYLPMLTTSVDTTGASPGVCESIDAAIKGGESTITKPSPDLGESDRNCIAIKGRYQIKSMLGKPVTLTISYDGYDAQWIEKTNALTIEKLNTKNTYELIDEKFKLIQGVDPLKKESRQI